MSAQGPMTIYVGPEERGGFIDTDEGVRDSIKDMQHQIRKRKQYKLVETPAAARLRLFVVRHGQSNKSALILATVACSVLAVTAAAQKPPRVSVYVVAQPGQSGFVEPGVPDSVRDLKSEIPKCASLRLALTAADAEIVLRVVDRRKVTREASGAAAFPVGGAVVALPLDTEGNVLSTVMELGDYHRPIDAMFSGIGGVWKECAEQVSKQLHEWVVANREQIAARKR